MSAIRVLQVLGCLDRGGAENMIMSVYRNIDREKIQFDFILHLKRPGDFDEEAKSLGAKLFYAPQYNGKNHFEYKKWWNDFFRSHPEYKLMHSHIRSTASICTEIAHKYGVKTIVHSHNTLNTGKSVASIVKNLLQSNITRNADKCLACSDAAGKWLFKDHEYTLLHNTIDSKKYTFNEEYRRKIREQYDLSNSFVVGHVGRYHKQKNQFFLMDIFAEILKKRSDSRLVLVGAKIGSDGIEKQELIEYAEKLNISDKIIFAGNVPNVNEFLSAFDVLAFPSIHEGLPVTLIEAQAAGLYCFVSDAVSKESKITDNMEFVSLEKAASEWAEKILSYDYTNRKNCYEDIYNAGYDIEAGVKTITNIYLSLLK